MRASRLCEADEADGSEREEEEGRKDERREEETTWQTEEEGRGRKTIQNEEWSQASGAACCTASIVSDSGEKSLSSLSGKGQSRQGRLVVEGDNNKRTQM